MSPDEHRNAVETAAKKVYAVLGEGYAESVYEAAIAIEFRKAGVPYAIENSVEVLYEGECVGMQRLDFVVGGEVAVEPKTSGSISKTHTAQTTAYMRTTQFALAIIVNFPSPPKAEPDFQIIRREESAAGEKPD